MSYATVANPDNSVGMGWWPSSNGTGGGGGGLFTCPYPLKVQAHPPRDQRLNAKGTVIAIPGRKCFT